ncbi:hypothetical protein MOO46_03745 [Apilactobacillus apisilvae]|uniref:Uncharacterized protein n=1 Tax=Apilactobacillus apisilvae TaxID=2923364 RepID=A0ABY4PJ58_9LACO|nr:hypothetical protein [Apilactobacillus apisilvae]UQS85673.1 hypothetical protein MOO46_03745 [Apilactobacillus apisilvae]
MIKKYFNNFITLIIVLLTFSFLFIALIMGNFFKDSSSGDWLQSFTTILSILIVQYFTIKYIGVQIRENKRVSIKVNEYSKKYEKIIDVGNDLLSLSTSIRNVQYYYFSFDLSTGEHFININNNQSIEIFSLKEKDIDVLEHLFDELQKTYDLCQKIKFSIEINDIIGSDIIIKVIDNISYNNEKILNNKRSIENHCYYLLKLIDENKNNEKIKKIKHEIKEYIKYGKYLNEIDTKMKDCMKSIQSVKNVNRNL